MLFLFACRADDLLYDFTIQSYWEAVQWPIACNRQMPSPSPMHYPGVYSHPWSDRVEVRIARGLVGILRDVGLLLGNRRNQQGHEIVPYDMSDEGVACLARELHDSGVSDSALCQHMDWRLFGLSCEHVHERLDKLGKNEDCSSSGQARWSVSHGESSRWRNSSMSSLDELFEELVVRLREPDALNPAKSDPILYFVFRQRLCST
jgi:hypothetical protein